MIGLAICALITTALLFVITGAKHPPRNRPELAVFLTLVPLMGFITGVQLWAFVAGVRFLWKAVG